MLKEDLTNDLKWNEFLEYKLSKDFVHDKEKKLLEEYIHNKKYKDICEKITNNNYHFSIPKKHVISKGHSSKKRIVYTFNDDEMIILKFISFLLYDYDNLFSPNLYSFRKASSVKNAIKNISNIKNINNMHGYKVDISNYFNSIDVNNLLNLLKTDIKDSLLLSIFDDILANEDVLYCNDIIKEKKGAMAGISISAFLANYYIKEIDEYFWNEKLVYLRYADDIILFCSSKKELYRYVQTLKDFFEKYNLTINKDKEYFFEPNSKWEFLGFSYQNGRIDLSQNTIRKIKAKIRRSARGIHRWMIKKDAKEEYALKAMNRKYNRKFFGKEENDELSWKYWFFPTITTSEGLKIIDNYMQNQQRYIATRKA